jgi:hypothetical protein
MQEEGKAIEASAATGGLSLEALIDLQRKTVTEHIRNELIKDWPGVYRTLGARPRSGSHAARRASQ